MFTPRWRLLAQGMFGVPVGSVIWILAIVLVVRILVAVWTANVTATSPFSAEFVASWTRWDAEHYVLIAEQGYQSPTVSSEQLAFISRFPPLFSWAISLVHQASWLSAEASGIFLSNLFLFLSSLLIFRLGSLHLESAEVGYWSVLFLNLFPTSYFASSSYSEAMFLFALALYFYSLKIGRSYTGLSLTFATATLIRSVGVLLYPAHIYLFWKEEKKSWKTITGLLFPGCVFLAHLAYVHLWRDMPGYLESTEKFSIQVFSRFPFSETFNAFSFALDYPEQLQNPDFLYGVGYNALFMVAGTALTLYGLPKLFGAMNIFSITHVLFLSITGVMISGPRFFFVHLPIFLILAQLPSRLLKGMMAICFLVTLLVFSGRFVTGSWTF